MFVRLVRSSGSKAEVPIGNRSSSQLGSGFPALDITQDDENVYVRAQMPGLRPHELSISTLRHSISLAGKQPVRSDAEPPEAARGSFSCTVALPAEVDTESVDAGYCEGVLTLTLSKITLTKDNSVS